MVEVLHLAARTLCSAFRMRTDLMVENLLLRQQLQVALRSKRRPALRRQDRLFWVLVRGLRSDWRRHLHVVRPATVIRWHLIVVDERHLHVVLAEFANYYNRDRPHRSLGLQTPVPRAGLRWGRVVSRPVLGGLHHVYARVA